MNTDLASLTHFYTGLEELDKFLKEREESKNEKKRIHVNYSRCYCRLFYFLMQRCKVQDNVDYKCEKDKFLIKKRGKNVGLAFIRNPATNTFFIDKFFEITNEHLLGLYNPFLSFDIVSSLIEIRRKFSLNIIVQKNEIVLLDNVAQKPEKISIDFFIAFVQALDDLSNILSFKIQLAPHNYFVINRTLKASWNVIEMILRNNALKEIIEFSFMYFKCFSIPPICCRMQSVAPTKVFDFEKFSFYHISEKYFREYIAIAKFLYPLISEINSNMLKRSYLEIIPTTIVNLKKPLKLLEIFKNLDYHGIDVISLASGNMRLSNYLDISAEMLLSIIHPEKLKNSFDKMNILQQTHNFGLVKLEDLIAYDPIKYFEYQCVEYGEYLPDNSPYSKKHDIRNKPLCISQCPNVVHSIDTLIIITSLTYPTLFFQTFRKHDAFVEVHAICELIQACFDPGALRLHSNTDISSFISDSFDDDTLRSSILDNCYFFEKCDSDNNERMKTITNLLKMLEESDGICLSVIGRRIETVEHFNSCLLELHQVNDDTLLDTFQYSSNDLNMFFEWIKNKNLNGLTFTITNYQTIVFNNYCEIRPATFLKFKDKDSCLRAVKYFCDTMNPKQLNTPSDSGEFLQKFFPNWDDFLVSAGTSDTTQFVAYTKLINLSISPDTVKNVNIEIAKELNPVLKNLEHKYFDVQQFQCIPCQFIVGENANNFLVMLKKARDHRFRLVYFKSNDTNIPYIRLDDFAFRFNYFAVMLKPSCLREFIRLIEDISVELQGYLVVKDAYIGEIKHYNSLHSGLIGIPFNSKIASGMENEIYLQKCLNILGKNEISARVLANCNFILDSMVFIESRTLLKICQTQDLHFFQALKIFKIVTTESFVLPDHWISITREMVENPFKRAGGFSIVDNKTNDYMKLVKIIQPSLKNFSDENLLSFKYLELLPHNLLLELEDVGNLLRIFEALENNRFVAAENGNVNFGSIQLPTHMWLKVINPQNLVKVNDMISKINKNVDHENQIVLHSSGLLSNIEESDDRYPLPTEVVQHQNDLKKYMNRLKDKAMDTSLSLTLNYNGDIKFGKHIWLPLHMIKRMYNVNKLEIILDIARIFDDVFIDDSAQVSYLEDNFMKGVNNLVNQEKAKSLALLLNFILTEQLYEFMECGMLLVFPKKLYQEWESDPDATFSKYSTVLRTMQRKGITYFFQFNGNINVEKTITLKPKQLLQISDFAEFESLLKEKAELHCKNEVKNFLNKDERVFKTKIESYQKIVEARKEADRVAKKRNHIEQNGTLFYQKCIWVRPNDFLNQKSGDKYLIHILYEKINKVFGNNLQFQYGRPQLPILTSVLLNSDQKLLEYCYMFCAYVHERDGNIEIQFFIERNQFKFNNAIFIYPRSFFHLQNIDAFVEALRKYSSNMTPDSIEREVRFIQDYIREVELQGVQRDERLEYDYMRKYCLKKIETIILQELPLIANFLPDLNNVIGNQGPELYVIENISIKEKFVFKGGVTGPLMENKKVNGVNNYQLKYDQNIFIVALKIAQDLSEVVENLFDMTSIIECIGEYCKGRRVEDGHLYQANENRIANTNLLMPALEQNGLIDSPGYIDMLNFFESQLVIIKNEQQKSRGSSASPQDKYIFSNAIKGLHHWIKHGEYFNSLEHYYNLMNAYFARQREYDLEFDYGMVLTRQYNEDLGNRMKYFGSLVIDPETEQKLCVATFYYEEKKPFTAWEKNLPCTKYLVFTDKPFRKDEKFTMNKEILVNLLKKQQPNFVGLVNEMNTNLKNFKEEDNVTKLLIINTASVTTIRLNDLKKINELQQKFKNARITLCCNYDLNLNSSHLPTFTLKNLLNSDVNWCNFHYNKFIEDVLFQP